MRVGVIGINHKLADLALREMMVREVKKLSCSSAAIVSLNTCNRVELYFSSDDLAKTHGELLNLLCGEIEDECAHKIYSYFGADCFLHLARVTAGMDSALLLETEIQGQVKQAYQHALSLEPLTPELHFLFQKSLFIGKRVRTLFPLMQKLSSLEQIIEKLATFYCGELTKQKILLVGMSQTNQKIATFLKTRGVSKLVMCNRSLQKESYDSLAPLNELLRWREYDLTIFATSSPHFLLSQEELCHSPLQRRVILDLSVPRNVDPKLAKLDLVTLLNVDEMYAWVDEQRERQAKMLGRLAAEQILEDVEKYFEIHRTKKIIRINSLIAAN